MRALDLYCGATHDIDADARQGVTPTFAEFFCGAGLARLRLGPRWRCVLANDNDPKKARAYPRNFGLAAPLRVCDIADLMGLDDGKHGAQLPRLPPAGPGARLRRSGAANALVENVPRLMTSNGPPTSDACSLRSKAPNTTAQLR
jgi:DNA (cytosine-5)-methyltransferase 1